MRFEELASRAGQAATRIGVRAARPPFSMIERERRRRKHRTGWSAAAAAALAVWAIALLWPGASPGQSEAAGSPTTTASGVIVGDLVPESCPVTRPGDVPFSPASSTPDGPPSSYDAVWYGTPDLWTMVDEDGQIWEGLPVGPDGSLTQKTLWWSDHLSSSDPLIEFSLTAEHLDGTAPEVETIVPDEAASSPSSPSFGIFVVVGFELPQPGCWKITAEYRDAVLSYVAWVPGGDDPAQRITLLDGSEAEITDAPELTLAGYLFTIHVAGLGQTNVDLAPGLDAADPATVDEAAVLEANLGDGVRLWRADREGQPLFMTVELDGWVAVLAVGFGTAPANEDLAAIADRVRGATGARGVALSEHTPESFTTFLEDPSTGGQIDLMAGECVMEMVPGAEIADDPRLGAVIRAPGFASWCVDDAGLEVRAHGDQELVDRLVAEMGLSRSGWETGP